MMLRTSKDPYSAKATVSALLVAVVKLVAGAAVEFELEEDDAEVGAVDERPNPNPVLDTPEVDRGAVEAAPVPESVPDPVAAAVEKVVAGLVDRDPPLAPPPNDRVAAGAVVELPVAAPPKEREVAGVAVPEVPVPAAPPKDRDEVGAVVEVPEPVAPPKDRDVAGAVVEAPAPVPPKEREAAGAVAVPAPAVPPNDREAAGVVAEVPAPAVPPKEKEVAGVVPVPAAPPKDREVAGAAVDVPATAPVAAAAPKVKELLEDVGAVAEVEDIPPRVNPLDNVVEVGAADALLAVVEDAGKEKLGVALVPPGAGVVAEADCPNPPNPKPFKRQYRMKSSN